MKHKYSVWMRICVLFVLCLALAAGFSACDESDGYEDTTGIITNDETDAPDAAFSIAAGGVSSFTMIAPESPTDGEEDAFMEIRSEIAAMTGVSLPFTDDWLRKGETHDPETYEILIGQTNYEETQTILRETSYGSYAIAAVGRKIILTAWSETAIIEGAEALLQILRDSLDGKDLVVPTSAFSATKVVDRTLDDIPLVPNLSLDHIYDANGAIEAIYENATVEHFSAYVAKMEEEGYTKYAENERGNVSSAILTDHIDHTFNIFYEGGYDQLCVIIEEYSISTLPPKAELYTSICDTQLVQLGVEYKYSGSSAPQNGMCYIWRLADSRFIILDGGFNYRLGASNLLDTLSEMAVNPDNIVIASWVISHFHSDHVGTFLKFAENHLYDASIESVIFNLPTDEQASLTQMGSGTWNRIEGLITQFDPSIRVYKAHPGQVYHFANAEIEILYTLEMYAPVDLTYYNTCSLVIDVKFGEFNMLMLGDCSEEANETLCKNYGEALEGEVVQVAHHGYRGGTTKLYKLIDPIYVFWPAGSTWFNTCASKVSGGSDFSRNAYFFDTDTRVEEIYVGAAAVILMGVTETGFTSSSIYKNVTAFVNGEGTTTEIDP